MSGRKVAFYLPSLEGGGAERVLVQLANVLASHAIQVDLVLARRTGPYVGEIEKRVNVVDLRAAGVGRSLPALVRYLRSSGAEVMLSALDHANIIAILANALSRRKIRCVVSMRSVPTAVYRLDRSARRWFMLRLIKYLYPFANCVIANSRAVALDLSQSLRISETNLRVIYNPLNLMHIDQLSNVQIEQPFFAPDARPFIVAVGSLTTLKDFQTLVRAFSIVRRERDCRLVILGEGPDRQMLEGLIDSLDLRSSVHLMGFMDNPFPWLKRAAVFVSASLTEGCPNALLQALACNKRIVSTDCIGGSAEILQDGKWGSLVPVGDFGKMAAAILENLDAVSEIDLSHRAQDFAIEKIAEEYARELFPCDV